MELTDGSFRGMVHPADLGKIQNQIQAWNLFVEISDSCYERF